MGDVALTVNFLMRAWCWMCVGGTIGVVVCLAGQRILGSGWRSVNLLGFRNGKQSVAAQNAQLGANESVNTLTKGLHLDWRSRVRSAMEAASMKSRSAVFKALCARATSTVERRRIASLALQVWAEMDPAGAREEFRSLSTTDRLATVGALASALAESDPVSAITWAKGLDPAAIKLRALGECLAEYVRVDPVAAQEQFRALDESSARTVAKDFYGAWVESDGAGAAAALASASQRGVVGPGVLRAVGERWGDADPAAAAKWVEDSLPTNPSLQQFGLSIVASAGSIAPQTTLDALMAAPASGQSADFFRSMATTEWLEQDPVAARAWLQQQDSATELNLVNAATGIQDAASAKAWLPLVENLPDASQRSALIQSFVGQWAVQDPEAALQYVQQLSDPSLQANLLPAVAQGLAKTDPQLAFQTALSLGSGPARASALASISSQWAQTAPSVAVASIGALQEGDLKTDMLITVAGVWGSNDAVAAATAIENLPTGLARDNALMALGIANAARNPTLALQIANAISTPVVRQEVLGRLPN